MEIPSTLRIENTHRVQGVALLLQSLRVALSTSRKEKGTVVRVFSERTHVRVFRVSLARLKESRFESFRRSRRMRLLIPFATPSKKRNEDDDDELDGWIIVLPTCLK